jgi:hypothetical protein
MFRVYIAIIRINTKLWIRTIIKCSNILFLLLHFIYIAETCMWFAHRQICVPTVIMHLFFLVIFAYSSIDSVGNYSLKCPNFEMPILNQICKQVSPVILQTYKMWNSPSSSFAQSTLWIRHFRLLYFLLLKECKAHMPLSRATHNYPCSRLSKMIAEFERGSVKLLA